MPCNAIATVTGGVTDQTLRRLLEQHQQPVRATIASYLRQRFNTEVEERPTTQPGFSLRVGGYPGLLVTVTSGSKLRVEAGSGRLAEAEQLTAELSALLTLLGQQLFEQAVADFIQTNYKVEQSQRVADQLVITFNI